MTTLAKSTDLWLHPYGKSMLYGQFGRGKHRTMSPPLLKVTSMDATYRDAVATSTIVDDNTCKKYRLLTILLQQYQQASLESIGPFAKNELVPKTFGVFSQGLCLLLLTTLMQGRQFFLCLQKAATSDWCDEMEPAWKKLYCKIKNGLV